MQLDSTEYTLNLEITANAYLKAGVTQLLQGYCEGKFPAYYPKYDRNEVLHHDFMAHYAMDYMNTNDDFCWQDFCGHPDLLKFYKLFSKKVKIKEYIYVNHNRNIVQREVAWIQLYYEGMDRTGAMRLFPSIKFWFREVGNSVTIYHKDYAKSYSLQQVIDNRFFIINEQFPSVLQQKVIYNDDNETH
jgi:hypothetical protein